MKKHIETKAILQLQRRRLIKAGSLGLAMLLGERTAFAASAEASNAEALSSGRILGLTTTGKEEDTSQLLSINLANDQTLLKSLDQYRLGHSLLALPNGEYFAVPYGEEQNPCLFLDQEFSKIAEVFAPVKHGFGGHAVLLPDNKTLVTHFNKSADRRGRTVNDKGQLCLIDIAERKVIQTTASEILHGHDMILTRDRQTLIIADDGNIESPVPAGHPYGLISYKPALHLFNANTMVKQKTIALPINGSLVHIEEGLDQRIYGGTEQFVNRDNTGIAILDKVIGKQRKAYLESITHEQYEEEVPLPGPLIGVDLENLEISSTTRVEQSDPFDIRLNLQTGLLFCVYSSSNQLARFNPDTRTWAYFSTLDLQINEPFGLIEIPGSNLMVVNGYERGIAIFDALTMTLVRHYDIPTHGLKHMLYSA